MMFIPSYTASLEALHKFVPKAGHDYASKRNYDDLANVSAMSPYIRHRVITEEQVLCAILQRHSAQAAEKFIQEVFWRTYWKGWLELRPSIWAQYKKDLAIAGNRLHTEAGLRRDWDAACNGQTGIACFDRWAGQLAETGYLHNHARMWFASIWIFTLRLPWALGADLFLRQLLDGDPASNTLSWRWVAGLQTKGKTYLARPDNIAKYTDGRFRPTGLASYAAPLDGPPHPPLGPLPTSDPVDPTKRTGLLITEDDLSPGWLVKIAPPVATALIQTTDYRSPRLVAPHVKTFVEKAMKDCATRSKDTLGPTTYLSIEDLQDWAEANQIEQIVTSYLPIGPTADAFLGHAIIQVMRTYDSAAWPFATHGFFKFKDKIPKLLERIDQP